MSSSKNKVAVNPVSAGKANDRAAANQTGTGPKVMFDTAKLEKSRNLPDASRATGESIKSGKMTPKRQPPAMALA